MADTTFMMLLLVLLVELIGLYILSHSLTQAVYDLTILLFRSRTIGITVISVLAFPGTIIHELAHLFTAEVLGVRTGKLTLVPEGLDAEDGSSQNAGIKAGSVMVAHTDPFRRYAIGLAPIFIGMLIISSLAYLLFNPTVIPENQMNIDIFSFQLSIVNFIILYLLLATSNSMFSSKEDLKGFIPFGIALGIIIAAAYVAGLRIGLTGALLELVGKILYALTKSLGVVVVINIVSFALVKGGILLVQKITRRKLIHR